MSWIKRRQFLQFAGSTLATLGLSQLDLLRASERYGRVLAQSTPRKLALLVGINKYLFDPLEGCVMDTFLQQQLLIHRFGFNSQDIVILTDEQATRQNILNRFEEHLIKQAKPGDVVVYHFSGHGSQVRDPDYPNCDFPDCLNSTFVPIDSALPAGFPNQSGAVKDIMGRTLFLLMSAIQTENFTAVLDSCYSGGGTRGNVKVRSRSGGSKLQPIEDEQAYQQQWLSKLGIAPTEFKQRRLQGVAKGVVIASARRDQLAIDSPFNGFSAGAFTYLMTQYLWQQTGSEPFSRVIPNVARSTLRLTSDKQEPLVEYKPGSDYPQRPTYFLNEPTPPAEAVITKVEGNQAELWLGGLDPDSLTAFDRGAILSVVDLQGREQGRRVQLEARIGLVGQAKLLDTVQPGAFLQERSRSIPNNLTLKIGLDPSLGNEANQAKQALASISRLEALPLQQQEVQYIFGRMTDSYQQQLQVPPGSKLPDVGSLGLFSPALELIPDSFGVTGETITSAVTRLRPKFQSLLAARIVKTALNTNSSRLNVVASMQPEGGDARLATAFPIRGVGAGTPTNQLIPAISSNSQQLPLGTPVQIQVKNNETHELYLSVLVIDPTGEISVIFPNLWVTAEEVTLVAAGSTLKIPDPTKDSFRLVAQEPKGVAEVLILASRTPLRQALQALRELAARDNKRTGVVDLRGSQQQNEPAKVMDYLLDDINNGTRGRTTETTSSTDRNIDTSQLAALSITFEVI